MRHRKSLLHFLVIEGARIVWGSIKNLKFNFFLLFLINLNWTAIENYDWQLNILWVNVMKQWNKSSWDVSPVNCSFTLRPSNPPRFWGTIHFVANTPNSFVRHPSTHRSRRDEFLKTPAIEAENSMNATPETFIFAQWLIFRLVLVWPLRSGTTQFHGALTKLESF